MDLINYIQANREKLKRAPLGMYGVVPALGGKHYEIGNYDAEVMKYKNVIKPGVIFCLRRIKSSTELKKYNPLEPYYLIYIYDDGTIKFSYINSKGILDVYRLLCLNKKEVYQKLCDLFNANTKECQDMKHYIKLLEISVKKIVGLNQKQNMRALTQSRTAKLLNREDIIEGMDDFELVSFLVLI
jgi:hypothetical protein